MDASPVCVPALVCTRVLRAVELAALLARQAPGGSGPTGLQPASHQQQQQQQALTQLSLASTALATSLASARGLLRQLGVTPALPRQAPEQPSQLADALAGAMQQLSTAVHGLQLGARNSPPPARAPFAFPTLADAHAAPLAAGGTPPAAGSAAEGAGERPPGGAPAAEPGLDARLAALRLEQSEARCRDLQSQVRQLTQQIAAQSLAAKPAATQPQQEARGPSPPLQPQQQQREAEGGEVAAQARRLLTLLQQGVAALQAACHDLEAACLAPEPSPAELRQPASVVVSELLGLEATVNLLSAELSKLASASQTGTAVAVAPEAPRRQQAAASPAPSTGSWVTATAGELTPAAAAVAAGPAGRGERAGGDGEGGGTPASEASSGPSLAGLLQRRGGGGGGGAGAGVGGGTSAEELSRYQLSGACSPAADACLPRFRTPRTRGAHDSAAR